MVLRERVVSSLLSALALGMQQRAGGTWGKELTSGGEGPARAALLLVLHGGDGTGGGPVHGGGQGLGLEQRGVDVLHLLAGGLQARGIAGLELLTSQVSEGVHAHLPALAGGVVGSDLGHVGGEDRLQVKRRTRGCER